MRPALPRRAGRRTNLALLGLLLLAFGTGRPRLRASARRPRNDRRRRDPRRGRLGLLLLVPWKAVVVRRARRRPVGRRDPSAGDRARGARRAHRAHRRAARRRRRRPWAALGGITALHIARGRGDLRSCRSSSSTPGASASAPAAPTSPAGPCCGPAASAAGAAALWAGSEGALRLTGAPGAERRGTGSHEHGTDDPAAMPVTQWFADTVPERARPTRSTVVVGGPPDPDARSADLDRGDRVRAVLDCTGGWYAEQDWAGVRLDRLLADLGDADLPADGSVDVVSGTGYRRRLPLRDAWSPAARGRPPPGSPSPPGTARRSAGRARTARLLVGEVGAADRGRRRTVVASAAVPAPVRARRGAASRRRRPREVRPRSAAWSAPPRPPWSRPPSRPGSRRPALVLPLGQRQDRAVRVELRRDLRLDRRHAPACAQHAPGTARSAPPARWPPPPRRPHRSPRTPHRPRPRWPSPAASPSQDRSPPDRRPPAPPPTARHRQRRQHRPQQRRRPRPSRPAPGRAAARAGTSSARVRCVHSPAVDSTPRASSTQRGRRCPCAAIGPVAASEASPLSASIGRWRPAGSDDGGAGERLAGAGGQGLADLEPHQRRRTDGPARRTAGRGRGSGRRSWRVPFGDAVRRSCRGGELEEEVLEAALDGAQLDEHVTAGGRDRADLRRIGPGHDQRRRRHRLHVEPGGLRSRASASGSTARTAVPVVAEQRRRPARRRRSGRRRSPAAGRPCARPR